MALPPPKSPDAETYRVALARTLNLAALTLVVCDTLWRVLEVHGTHSVVRVGDLVPELARLLSQAGAGRGDGNVEIGDGRRLRAVEVEQAPGHRVLVWLRRDDADDPRLDTSRILREQYGLGNRAQQLLKLLAEGLSNREIAAELRLREATVKTYLHHLYEALGVRSRTAAVAHVRGAVSQLSSNQLF